MGTRRRNSTRVDEGKKRKSSSLVAIKKKRKARTVVGRGEKRLLCDPGSELRPRGREKRRAKVINGMQTKQKTAISNVFFNTLGLRVAMKMSFFFFIILVRT